MNTLLSGFVMLTLRAIRRIRLLGGPKFESESEVGRWTSPQKIISFKNKIAIRFDQPRDGEGG